MQSSWNSGAISGKASFKKVTGNTLLLLQYQYQYRYQYQYQYQNQYQYQLKFLPPFTKCGTEWMITYDPCKALLIRLLFAHHWRANSLLRIHCFERRDWWNELTGEAGWSEGVAIVAGSLSFSSLAGVSTKKTGNLTKQIKKRIRKQFKWKCYGQIEWMWIVDKEPKSFWKYSSPRYDEGFIGWGSLRGQSTCFHLVRMLPIVGVFCPKWVGGMASGL